MAKVVAFDVADYLDSPETIAAYLTEAFEADDPRAVLFAINHVARARGMTSVADNAGLSREKLYRSLGHSLESEATPEFGAIIKLLHALGIELVARVRKGAAFR